MAEPSQPPEDTDPLALAQIAAAQLGGEWQLDEIELLPPESAESEEQAPQHEEAEPAAPQTQIASGGLRPPLALFPKSQTSAELPPSPEQLVEAMLFAGGHPLGAEAACQAIRGLTPERFLEAVALLNRRYRDQHRPYSVEARDGGFVLAVRPAFKPLREKLFGGPRETRLSQPALDVLSVVAYRQPAGKSEVDAVRGTDSGAILRQLVRLGLIAVQHRADADGREVRYGTTPRFLQVFALGSLDELPRLGDPSQV